jgi:hypothetical protein
MPVRTSLYVVPPAHAAFKADVMKDRQGTASSYGGLNTDRQTEDEPEKLPNGKYRY